jgi:lysozyme
MKRLVILLFLSPVILLAQSPAQNAIDTDQDFAAKNLQSMSSAMSNDRCTKVADIRITDNGEYPTVIVFLHTITASDTIGIAARDTVSIAPLDIVSTVVQDIASIAAADLVSIAVPDIVITVARDTVSIAPLDIVSIVVPDIVSIAAADMVSIAVPDIVITVARDTVSIAPLDIVSIVVPDIVSIAATDMVSIAVPDIVIVTAPDPVSIAALDIINIASLDIVSVTTSDIAGIAVPDIVIVTAPDPVSITALDVINIAALNIVSTAAKDMISIAVPDMVSTVERDTVSIAPLDVVSIVAPDIVSIAATDMVSVAIPDIVITVPDTVDKEKAEDTRGSNGNKETERAKVIEVRTPVAIMHLSPDGYSLLQKLEGYAPSLYNLGDGGYTIGFGFFIPFNEGHKWRNGITWDQATDLIQQKVPEYEDQVKEYVNVPLTQNEFDALTMLAYNLGGFSKATSIINDINEQVNIEKLQSDWKRFVHSKAPNVSKGLMKRRKDEIGVRKAADYQPDRKIQIYKSR